MKSHCSAEQRNSHLSLAAVAAIASGTVGLLGCFYYGSHRNKNYPSQKTEPKKLLSKRIPASREDAKCLQPLQLPCGLKLKNRIIRAAAFGGSDIESLLRSHVEVAKGGAAMTTIAYAAVSADGRTFENQLCVNDPTLVSGLRRIADAVHAEGGCKLSIQLAHAGSFADRKVTKSQQIAPSRIFNPAGFDFARQMTLQDMDRVAADYVQAALVVQQAGCDAIELHCGHGYLLSQFLSPSTNTRTDKYGGNSIHNRLRFPLRVLNDIRRAVGPEFAILVKMNLSDGFLSGLALADAKVAAQCFCEASADALVLSGGFTSRNGFFMLRGIVPYWSMARALGGTKGLGVLLFGRWLVPYIEFEECFFLNQALEVHKTLQADSTSHSSKVPICLVGGVVSLSAIEGVLDEGLQLVQMARALIQNPRMVRDIEDSLPVNKEEPRQEARGSTSSSTDIESSCTHCNECVVSTLDPSRGMDCPIKGQRHQDRKLFEW